MSIFFLAIALFLKSYNLMCKNAHNFLRSFIFFSVFIHIFSHFFWKPISWDVGAHVLVLAHFFFLKCLILPLSSLCTASPLDGSLCLLTASAHRLHMAQDLWLTSPQQCVSPEDILPDLDPTMKQETECLTVCCCDHMVTATKRHTSGSRISIHL